MLRHFLYFFSCIGFLRLRSRYLCCKRRNSDLKRCTICFEDTHSFPCKLNCEHSFHFSGIFRWILTKNECPLCRAPILGPTAMREEQTSRQHGNIASQRSNSPQQNTPIRRRQVSLPPSQPNSSTTPPVDLSESLRTRPEQQSQSRRQRQANCRRLRHPRYSQSREQSQPMPKQRSRPTSTRHQSRQSQEIDPETQRGSRIEETPSLTLGQFVQQSEESHNRSDTMQDEEMYVLCLVPVQHWVYVVSHIQHMNSEITSIREGPPRNGFSDFGLQRVEENFTGTITSPSRVRNLT